jgi:cobalt/nickel transport protein
MEKRHIIMLIMVAVIIIFPLALYNGHTSSGEIFSGSDSQGTDLITSEGYKPWFNSIWEPPSPEIESLLFSLQAAIGALIIGYFIGYYKGKQKREEEKE